MATIASRVTELIGHGGGGRETPTLPRLPYLLREAVPLARLLAQADKHAKQE